MSNRPIGIDVDRRSDISSRRNDGWAAEQVDDLEFNQAIYQQTTDHVWGFQAQTGAGSASIWTDASGDVFDKDSNPIVFQDQDKILINHDVQAAANLLIKFGQKKVTIEMLSGVTLDMDTFDLTLGESGDSIGGDIILTQTGTLTINGNRGLKINNSRDVYSDFTTKNLIINVQSNTTVDADADNIIFVDGIGGGKRVNNIDQTFDMTTDRIEGTGTTNELPSTQYQMWMDSLGVIKLAPDLVSVADGTTSNKLVDSAADFVTYLVQVGDIVFNLTDLTQTTVTAIDDLNTLSLADDIFVSSENYKIRMLSPPGLGSVKARIGAVFNNISSHLDDSTYTQTQEEKFYTEVAGDFTVTGSSWTTTRAFAGIYQVNDWTGIGAWKTHLYFVGAHSGGAITSYTTTISGIVFEGTSNNFQPVVIFVSGTLIKANARVTHGSNTIIAALDSSNAAIMSYHIDAELDKKPTFHN